MQHILIFFQISFQRLKKIQMISLKRIKAIKAVNQLKIDRNFIDQIHHKVLDHLLRERKNNIPKITHSITLRGELFEERFAKI